MAEDQNRTFQDKFMLRFPEGMRDEIKASADLLGRSMNAEIIQRLKRSFKEDRDDRVKLDLDGDVWNALMADAAVHDMHLEDRAVEILSKAYSPESGHTQALEKLLSVSNEMGEMSELIADMKAKEDADFILFYGKVIQMRQFVSLVLDAGDDVPAAVRSSARDLADLSQAEIETLRQRHEDAMFRRSLVEQRRRTSSEIAENEDG